jgi:hypothetical protein
MNDAFGNEVKVGDEIAYAVRTGSTVRMNRARIVSIDPIGFGQEQTMRVKKLATKANWYGQRGGFSLSSGKTVVLSNPLFVRLAKARTRKASASSTAGAGLVTAAA